MTTEADDRELSAEPVRAPGRREQLLEVLVFLFLIVPSMVLSLFAFQHQNATFAYVAWAVMLRDIALVCLILFFIWRNGEPRRTIGLSFRHGWREIAVGAALFIPFYFFAEAIEQMFKGFGLTTPPGQPAKFLTPTSPADFVLAFFLVVVVAISEETMFRGYLIRRFAALTRSPLFALICSSAIFSIGHGYEGSAGMATVGVMGFIFGLVYIWRGSLVAPITMHFLQDLLGIVVAPLLMFHH